MKDKEKTIEDKKIIEDIKQYYMFSSDPLYKLIPTGLDMLGYSLRKLFNTKKKDSNEKETNKKKTKT